MHQNEAERLRLCQQLCVQYDFSLAKETRGIDCNAMFCRTRQQLAPVDPQLRTVSNANRAAAQFGQSCEQIAPAETWSTAELEV